MGAETAAIGIAIAGAVAASGAAAQQAKAASDAGDNAKNAAIAQKRQLAEAAKLEKSKAIIQKERVQGRLRVLAAAAGLDTDSGSFETALNQADYENSVNLGIIDQNTRNQYARVQSGYAADMAEVSNRQTAAVANLLPAYLGSVNTGLSIGQAIKKWNE